MKTSDSKIDFFDQAPFIKCAFANQRNLFSRKHFCTQQHILISHNSNKMIYGLNYVVT